jgi:hypothetical protein
MRATRKSYCAVKTRLYDEHSMMGRPDWAWIKHRNEEFRRPMDVLDAGGEGQIRHHDSVLLEEDIYSRPHGGIPMIYVFGDTNQLPPVMKKPAYSTEPSKAGTADALGMVAFSEFIDPPNENEAESVIVIMKHVIRRNDRAFLALLSAMREGNVSREQARVLRNRCLEKLTQAEQDNFKNNALCLVPTSKQANQIIHNYLQHTMTNPIAKIHGKLQSIRNDGKNCCARESKLPMKNALCVGAKVMLLNNFLVEHHLMNGSIGVVKHLCYKHREGPNRYSENELQYAIVDFPECTIPEENKFFPDLSSSCVPIPFVQERCAKKCCTINALPLCCCAALSIYKSQGMTVGPGKPFEKVIIYYPTEAGRRTIPGLELVATSRAMNLNCLAIGNREQDLTFKYVMNIGATPAYQNRKMFLQDLEQRSAASQLRTRDGIKALDPATNKSYEGGAKFLLDWYDKLASEHASSINEVL